MDRKLQERMVGAAVLILALVIVGPMVLDGGPEPAVDEDVPGQRSEEVRTHTFQIGQSRETAPPGGAAPDVPAPAPEKAATSSPAVPPQPASSPEPVVVAPVSAPVTPAPVAAAKPPPAPKAPASAPAPGGGGKWVVQVGTFGQKDNANRLVTKLGGGGFNAFVSPTTRDGKTLYRVRVGPAGTRDAAGEVAKRLAAAGQPGQVVAQ
jgi:DedD protein